MKIYNEEVYFTDIDDSEIMLKLNSISVIEMLLLEIEKIINNSIKDNNITNN